MAEATYGRENTLDFIGLNVNAGQLSVGKGVKTATSAANAVTFNQPSGVVTTESVSTAASGTYLLTLTNSFIVATDIIFATVGNGSNTTGTPSVGPVTPGNGSCTIVISNDSTAAAFNGTLKISFMIVKV